MKRFNAATWALILLMSGALGLASSRPGAAQDEDGGPDCNSVPACVTLLRDHQMLPAPAPGVYASTGMSGAQVGKAMRRLTEFGDDGVVAILPLLEDPNPYVRTRAGYALARFRAIAPRHAAALIQADRSGVSWLDPAIAATGSEEALAYLWAKVMAKADSGGPATGALRQFGERVHPLLRAELERCRDGLAEVQQCRVVNSMVGQFPALAPFAMEVWEATARSPRAAEAVRSEAANALIRRKHPDGLAALMRRLEPFVRDAAARREPPSPLGLDRFRPAGDQAYSDLWAIGRYGAAAMEAGPQLVTLLQARGMPESRAAAARALGQIGYRPAIPVLLAQAADFEDDWGLAYEVVEALGRLGGGEALLETVARDYWFEPVRFNAQRALNLMRGGKFERPGVPGDGDPMDGSISGSFQLLYAGDDPPDFKVARGRCPAMGDPTAYGQFNPKALKWPSRSKPGPTAIGFVRPTPEEFGPFLAKHPDFKPPRQSKPTLMFTMGDYTLVGTDAGEFGGGLEVFGPDGKHHTLSYKNAWAAFPIRGGVLIVTESVSLSTGYLLVVKPDKAGPQIVRQIRLNSSPHRFLMAWPKTLIISARADHVAITQDARGELHLSDASRLPVCNR